MEKLQPFNPNRTALVHVDIQRGFMPVTERHEAADGYGELAVPEGHDIVWAANALAQELHRRGGKVVTTQDWHPEVTAHFAKDGGPWPVHCVAETAGAEFHPELDLSVVDRQFIKGVKQLKLGEPDDSYTGVLAFDRETGQTLPDYLEEEIVNTVVVDGLALGDGGEHKLCADSTAVDLKKLGYRVLFAIDATRPVFAEQRDEALENFKQQGIEVVTSPEIIAALNAA